MKKKILIIDDEKAIRNSFILTFENSDFQIDVAENGRIGLGKFNKTKYDLVFLDLKMPDITGVEVLKEIQKTERIIPVYIITAFHAEFLEELNEVRNSGVDFEILNKPLGRNQLISIVNAIIGEEGMLRNESNVKEGR